MPLRKERRVPLCLAVSVSQRAAISADVSHSGFCLESAALHEAGNEVTGFVLHGDKQLNWVGRVAWVEGVRNSVFGRSGGLSHSARDVAAWQ